MKKNKPRIKATCLKTNKTIEFKNQAEAARDLGLNPSHINSCLKGTRNHTGNYKFEIIPPERMDEVEFFKMLIPQLIKLINKP